MRNSPAYAIKQVNAPLWSETRTAPLWKEAQPFAADGFILWVPWSIYTAKRCRQVSGDQCRFGRWGNRCLIVLRWQPLNDEKVSAAWLQSWSTEPGRQAIWDLKGLSSSNTCSFQHQYSIATVLGGLPASPLNQPALMEISGNGNAYTFSISPSAISCPYLADAGNTHILA